MRKANLTQLILQWNRIGIAFGGGCARKTPDLERLILQTARVSPKDSRLFTMVATWLCKYGKYVAKHRLKRLAADEVGSKQDCRPILGLLLDIVRGETGETRFDAIIRGCEAVTKPRPLFDIDRRNDAFLRLAERRASEISKRWGLWTQPIELKFDALRSVSWITENNSQLPQRALLRGGLCASILAELELDPSAGVSESELARRCGVTRAAIRDSLEVLELAGVVARAADQKGNAAVLCDRPRRQRKVA